MTIRRLRAIRALVRQCIASMLDGALGARLAPA